MNAGDPKTADGRIAEQIGVMQTVCGILIAATGVAVIAATTFVFILGPTPADFILTYMVVGFSGLMIILRPIIPSILLRQQVSQLEASGDSMEKAEWTSQLINLYQSSIIIGMSLLNGAAIACLIAYYFEAHWSSLASAVVLVMLMVVSFPTRGRVEDWVENEMRSLNL